MISLGAPDMHASVLGAVVQPVTIMSMMYIHVFSMWTPGLGYMVRHVWGNCCLTKRKKPVVLLPSVHGKNHSLQGFGTRCSAVVDCVALRVVFDAVVLRGAAVAWRWSEPVRH